MGYSRRDGGVGFTIVELLIVIVVIGILAAITFVAYNGLQSRAMGALLTSDLTNASKQLKLFQVTSSAYPTSIDCSQPDSATNKCIKPSTDVTYQYVVNNSNPQMFCLTAMKGSNSYNIGQTGTVMGGQCPVMSLDAGDTMSYSGSGTSWVDLSGSGNTATLNNGVGYSGINGGILSFDGVDDYVKTAIIPASDSFAISIWFKTTTPRDSDRLYWGAGSNKAILANSGTSGKLMWYVQTATSSVGYKYTSNNSTVGAWNNVVLQYTGDQVQCFINGVQDSVIANLGGVSNSSAFNIGTNYANSGNWYNGLVGGVSIHTRSLTPAEINHSFNTLRGRYGI